MRLSDLFRGRLTWRELGVLIRQLPSASRTRLSMGQQEGLWGLGEHLTALVIDELRTANWQRGNAGVKSGRQSKRPTPIPRPGTAKRSDKHSPERVAKRHAAKRRAAERRSAISRGALT
ncbi:hypothetical protein ACFQ61_10030 [Streptomyces sp. NPDC056500]|uniref:hypothetical protein n=1 Tax=Streptomyces sp. NPDC056500 TaxID=3345840 RepID=UPI0036C84D79